MATLYQLTSQMSEIEAILDENGGELTPELEQAWAETRESLVSKTDSYNALLQKLKSSETAIDNEMKRLLGLKKTVQNGQRRIKEHILSCMNMFGIRQLEGDLCKMSVRKSQSLKVEDEVMLFPFRGMIDDLDKALPDYVTLEAKVSRTAIRDQFKGTDTLPAGCEYVDSESLVVK